MIDISEKHNFYIIADHLRTTIFAVADGATFTPKGRGYVLKKLVKKIALLVYLLNLNISNLRTISEKLIEINSVYYPQLEKKKSLIISEIEKEITKALQLINGTINKLDNYYSPQITAQDIFFWYDTHGIPYELIKNYLEKKNYQFPEPEFKQLLTEQKKRSLADRKKKNVSAF